MPYPLKTPSHRLTIFIVLLLFALSNPVSAADEESKLGELTEAIGRLTSWIKGAEGRKKDLEEALKSSEIRISQVSREMTAIRKAQRQNLQELKQLESQAHELKRSSKAQKDKLIKQIQAAHRLGSSPATKALLSAEDPHQLSRLTQYMNYVNQARKEKLEEFSASLAQVSEHQQKISAKRKTLQTQESDLLDKQKEQARLKTKRAKTLAKLEKELGKSSVRLEQLKQDRIKLESIIASKQKALAEIRSPTDDKPFHKLKKKLPWPTSGRVIGGYRSLIGNSGLRANGITIDAKTGQPVTAIHYGQVVFSDWLRGFGLMIIIDHGDGFMSLYGHNDALNKDVGDWVQANDIIASAGNSGGATKSSLYFEIRKNGKPQNPIRWLARKK